MYQSLDDSLRLKLKWAWSCIDVHVFSSLLPRAWWFESTRTIVSLAVDNGFTLVKESPDKPSSVNVCVSMYICVYCLSSYGPSWAGVFSMGQTAFGLLACRAVSKHEQNKLWRLKNVVLMWTGAKCVTGFHHLLSTQKVLLMWALAQTTTYAQWPTLTISNVVVIFVSVHLFGLFWA